ncbi:MAG: F0F1 ATP synthase subunit epsilon [Oligoflexia bacterium]|nr:F0F1 ATP synthase subunit epsilon [Oligoflexia bacterium]
MSSDVFSLKIFTPAGLLLEDKVTSVTLPSLNGEIGILPQHAKYAGLLGAGVFQYSPAGSSETKRLAIADGFCTFENDTLTLLTDFAVAADNVDRNSYGRDRDSLQKAVDSTSTYEPAWQVAHDGLSRIQAVDRLLGVH